MGPVCGGNKPWDILNMSSITLKSSSTTTESHKELDPAVRNLKFRQFMTIGGEINPNGTEFGVPGIIIWKNYKNNYSSTFSAQF